MERSPTDGGHGEGRRDDLPEGSLELAPGVSVPSGTVRLSFSRSGGPGGQNVNKVATKAELRVSVDALPLRPGARARLLALAGRRVTDKGELVILSESERSQRRNRDECLEKLRDLIVRAMVVPKVRKKTRPGRGAVERRLQEKRVRSDAKRRRGNLDG